MNFYLQVYDRSRQLVTSAAPAPSPALAGAMVDVVRARAGAQQAVHKLTIEGRDYEGRASELYDDAGEVVGFVCVFCELDDDARTRARLSERLQFENLITHLSTHFIALKASDIDAGINHALQAIGEYCRVDRAYLFLLSAAGDTMSNTHEWCAPRIEPQISELQDLPIAAFPWWVARIRRQEVIHVPVVADMPEEASAEREILEAQAIQSVVAVPAVYQEKVTGFLGFDAVSSQKTWPDEDIALLRLVGEMLVSAIERKRAEEQRRVLEQELVQARSLENVAKLAGGVAHDFNNLLAIMLNCATILKRRVTDPDLAQVAGDLLQVSKQCADLTRQLLIVGRRGVVEPVLVNVNQVLGALENLLRKTVGESVRLCFELDQGAALVRMGLPQLEQVITNLTLNARDALGERGQIVVRTRDVELDAAAAGRYFDVTAGRYTVLEVEDDGCGMSADVAARAFEPFFTTKGVAGTGLGLSTVHGIVKQAGGHVELESSPGHGTLVRVHLPAARADAIGAPPLVEDDAVPPGNGELLLLVEDSDRLRGLVKNMLEQNRYRVLDARSPAEALALCERHAGSVDLLLFDVIMPDMSGRELAAQVSERFGLSRVAFMSGYDDDALLRQGLVPEGTWLLQKPFRENELLRFVRRAIDHYRALEQSS